MIIPKFLYRSTYSSNTPAKYTRGKLVILHLAALIIIHTDYLTL